MNESDASSPTLGSYRRFKASECNEVENPANEETIANISSATLNDSQRALEAAKWATLLPIKRAKLLPKFADSILAQQDRLVQIVTFQQGKPLKEAIGEVGATGNLRAGKKDPSQSRRASLVPDHLQNLAINRECPISVRSQFLARTATQKIK